MHRLPNGIDVGHFVGKELDYIQNSGDAEHDGIRKDVELRGKMDDAEALQEAKGRDGCVKIETRGKTGTENQADCFERIQGLVDPVRGGRCKDSMEEDAIRDGPQGLKPNLGCW